MSSRVLSIAAASILLALGTTVASALTFTKIVDTSIAIPGGGGNFSFGLGNTPAVSKGNVAFLANTGEVWTATIAGATKRRVIAPTAPIPNSGGQHFQFTYGDFVQIRGGTVVVVGEDCFGCNSGRGIYTVPLAGGVKVRLVDVNTLIPGSSTDRFSRFGTDFHGNDSRVVFSNRNNQTYSVPIGGGTVSLISKSCAPGGYCSGFQPTVDAIDKRVLLTSCTLFDNCVVAEFNVAGAGPVVDASKDIHPPGTPATYRFDPFHTNFNLPVIDSASDHRFAVFKGVSTAPSSPSITGIYSRGPAGFFKLVDSNTAVPGGTGNFAPTGFEDAGPRSLAAGNGIVIFRGVDAAGKLGIYAVRATGGAITKVIAQGDPIAGHSVDTVEPRSIGFRRDGFDGTTLVFLAQYAGGIGLFSTPVTLP